jgi:hypothetical protein
VKFELIFIEITKLDEICLKTIHSTKNRKLNVDFSIKFIKFFIVAVRREWLGQQVLIVLTIVLFSVFPDCNSITSRKKKTF